MSELELRVWKSSAHQFKTMEGGSPTNNCLTQWTTEQHKQSLWHTQRANSPSHWQKADKLELWATCPCQTIYEMQVRTRAGGVPVCVSERGGGGQGACARQSVWLQKGSDSESRAMAYQGLCFSTHSKAHASLVTFPTFAFSTVSKKWLYNLVW